MRPRLRLLVGPVPGHQRPRLWFVLPVGRLTLVLVVAFALGWAAFWLVVFVAALLLRR